MEIGEEASSLIKPHEVVIKIEERDGRSTPSPKGKGRFLFGVHGRFNARAALCPMEHIWTWKHRRGRRGQPQCANKAVTRLVGGYREDKIRAGPVLDSQECRVMGVEEALLEKMGNAYKKQSA